MKLIFYTALLFFYFLNSSISVTARTQTLDCNSEQCNARPRAKFQISSRVNTVDEIITFNASESYDVDGQIVQYTWDFGDGNFDSGVVVTHAYSKEREFSVKLKVTDDLGVSTIETKKINIAKKVTQISTKVFTNDFLFMEISETYDLQFSGCKLDENILCQLIPAGENIVAIETKDLSPGQHSVYFKLGKETFIHEFIIEITPVSENPQQVQERVNLYFDGLISSATNPALKEYFRSSRTQINNILLSLPEHERANTLSIIESLYSQHYLTSNKHNNSHRRKDLFETINNTVRSEIFSIGCIGAGIMTYSSLGGAFKTLSATRQLSTSQKALILTGGAVLAGLSFACYKSLHTNVPKLRWLIDLDFLNKKNQMPITEGHRVTAQLVGRYVNLNYKNVSNVENLPSKVKEIYLVKSMFDHLLKTLGLSDYLPPLRIENIQEIIESQAVSQSYLSNLYLENYQGHPGNGGLLFHPPFFEGGNLSLLITPVRSWLLRDSPFVLSLDYNFEGWALNKTFKINTVLLKDMYPIRWSGTGSAEDFRDWTFFYNNPARPLISCSWEFVNLVKFVNDCSPVQIHFPSLGTRYSYIFSATDVYGETQTGAGELAVPGAQ